jgi:hypothetical protein
MVYRGSNTFFYFTPDKKGYVQICKYGSRPGEGFTIRTSELLEFADYFNSCKERLKRMAEEIKRQQLDLSEEW